MPDMPLTGRKAKAAEEEVDFTKGLPWAGEKHKFDPEQDAWERSSPPNPGPYEVQLDLSGSKLVKPKEDQKTWYYSINIEGRVTNKHVDEENSVAFATVTTRRGRGKDTSTALGAIAKLGYKDKIPAEVTPDWEVKSLAKILSKNPVITWVLDWKASYQEADGSWTNVCNTYEDFPKLADGSRLHSFKVTRKDGGSEIVNAKLFVAEWIGKGEKPKEQKKVAAQEVDLMDDLTSAPLPNAAPKKGVQDVLDLD